MLDSTPPHIPGTPPRRPESVQPGGGWCMGLERAWGGWRRLWLRWCRPGYVRRMVGKRQGGCPSCPHQIIDNRDLKYVRNVCGYWFHPEDDAFRWRDRLRLARYGLAEVVIFSLLLGGVSALVIAGGILLHPGLYCLLVPIALVWLEIVYFFRDPERAIPNDQSALVSPADGTITNVEEVNDPDFPEGRALRISIFLSIFNVHVNRVPRAGRVKDVRYFPGRYLDARNPRSAVENEQLWIDLEEAETGRPLRVKQISGAIARRIVCWLKPGDTVKTGERLGMIKLGSRTDVLVPARAGLRIDVKAGDKVFGGSSVLLRFLD
jgi:phosphatidylserine decarboxylase